MNLPTTVPIDDCEGLCELQKQLLHIAEETFGQRDSSLKKYEPKLAKGKSVTILTGLEISRPRFTDEGPQVNFDLERREVFAELSTNGERYWPTVLYELAHETIHLLNPAIKGAANYLEEGVCVAFSIYAQRLYDHGAAIQRPKNNSKYAIALALVNQLPEPLLVQASRLRQMAGSLSDVSSNDLICLFPEIDTGLAVALTCKFHQPTDV